MARIYLVEDETIVRLYIENFLKKKHEVVGSSGSFEQAREEILRLQPDLVVSDIILLDKQGDGISLAQEVNKTTFIPFIFLTAVAFNSTDERFHHIPVYGYITKPIDEHRLLSTVELALMRLASEKQLEAFTSKLQLEIRHREQLEEELRQTLYRHEQFINQLSDVVFEIDAEGNLTFVNKAIERFLGYLPEEILGTPVINLVSDDFLFLSRELLHMFQEAIIAQRIFGERVYEISFRHKNGSPRWGRITFVPLITQSEILIGTRGIVYDITREKHQEAMLESRLKQLQKEKRYQTIIRYALERINEKLDPFPTLPALVDFIRASLSIDGVLLFRYDQTTSPAIMRRLFCVCYETTPCKKLLEYTITEEEKAHLTPVIYIRDKHRLPERFHFYWDEENIKEAALFPLFFEQRLFGLLACFWQNRRHLEHSFFTAMQIVAHILAQAIHRHEEWEAYQVTQKQLADQKLLMEKAESMATFGQMMSAITHEIRQPLQSIRLLSESPVYWAKHDRALPYEKLLENMEKISKRVVRIDNIIEGMRQAALSVTAIKPEKVKLHAVIEEMLELFQSQIGQNEIALEKHFSSSEIVVTFNQVQLSQVLTNLISNAIHILETQDLPRIIIETEARDGYAILRVADNGPGIPPEKEKYLFEPFFTTRPGVGMGIGLYVVKRLLSLYEAKITYRRQDNLTIFEITFPS